MVWARSKITIQDDLFRPRPRVTLHYTGPNPEKFYYDFPNIIATIFRISHENIQERNFKWEKGDPLKFSVKWEMFSDIDKYSHFYVLVSLDGTSSKGFGTATATLEAYLRTEYPQDTVWHRSIVYEFIRMFWHSSFYAARREHLLIEGRRLAGLMLEEVKRLMHM